MMDTLECTTCEGNGKIVEPACLTGPHQHSASQYDCEDCDGTGQIAAPFSMTPQSPGPVDGGEGEPSQLSGNPGRLKVGSTELLCPICQADTPSTEAFEHFGQAMCAECAASLYDPGDGWPGLSCGRPAAGRGRDDQALDAKNPPPPVKEAAGLR